ncbi:MAG: 16S rRNA (cytidine(1402)-2'-O)-methyltransferase [Desulfuromonadales bacterium]
MQEGQGQDTPGTLYVVATPIGNLEDITYRAVKVLGEVDLVAAEDTRHSRKLLDRFGIRKPLLSYHDHNERQRYGEILERLRAGETVALISDAGTPCIADPGYRLIAACRTAGVSVVPIPGASALIAALSVSGVATDRFIFEGYLPSRAKARTDLFKRLAGEQRTLVFYETPHRLLPALNDLVQVFGGERSLVIAREMTKLHEEFFRGSADGAVAHFSRQPVKGEVVLILPPGSEGPQMNARDALRNLMADSGLSRREAVKMIAREYGLPVSDVYRLSLDLTGKGAEDG